MERPQLTTEKIAEAHIAIKELVLARLMQKGRGAFASRHETLGIIQEEMHELVEAVRDGDLAAVRDELLDVAVAALIGLASADDFEW